MSQVLKDNCVAERLVEISMSRAPAPRATEASDSSGQSWLHRALTYYLWSVVLAVGVIAICLLIGVVTPFGHSMRWPVQASFFWVAHPVRVGAWFADAMAGPENDLGPQTAAWIHAFCLVECLLIAGYLAATIWLFHTSRRGSAVAFYCLALFWCLAGSVECYLAVTV